MTADSDNFQADTLRSPTTLVVANAKLSWLENGLPYSEDFQDTYHSTEGAQAESRYLFLEGNQLALRWRSASRSPHHADGCFVIAELGFGCGLNFLETLQLWTATQERPSRLHYLAFEKHPLTRADLARALKQWPELATTAGELLGQYSEHSAGCHRLYFGDEVILDLHYGDAGERLNAMRKSQASAVDAWYLDGFSPSLNPSLWDLALTRAIAAHSKNGTTATSYSVAGSARRALIAAGFNATKRAGFGKKRHSLYAVMGNETELFQTGSKHEQRHRQSQTAQPQNIPRPNRQETSDQDVLVIGAGLAGCSTALALARRGHKVKIVDAAPQAMCGASGIPQLALRPRLFRSAGSGASFFLTAYHTARRLYATIDALTALLKTAPSKTAPAETAPSKTAAWYPTGALQLDGALNKKQALSQETVASIYDPRVAQAVSAAAASSLAGLPVLEGGWHFEEAGWLDPRVFVDKLFVLEPRISPQFDTTIVELIEDADDTATSRWIAIDSRGNKHSAKTVVLCNSHAIDSLLPDLGIRLQTARGQVSLIKADADSAALRCVVSGERSLFPVRTGFHVISASYRSDPHSLATLERSAVDDEENLAGLAGLFAPLSANRENGTGIAQTAAESSTEEDSEHTQQARQPLVAIRSAGDDFLPVVGRAPAVESLIASLSSLRRNAKAEVPAKLASQEGLFVNVGHGSNGVATCPLSAEFLASLICGEPLPLTAAEAELISPARFIIRDIKKQVR